MAKKNYVIGAGILAVAVGIAIGVAGGFQASKGTPASAAAQTSPGPFTNAAIESLKANIDQTTQYEMAYGCVDTDKMGNKVLCGQSKEKVDALLAQMQGEVQKAEIRSPEQVNAVLANLRTLTDDPQLTADFKGNYSNFYTNAEKRVEQYRDAKGFVYTVDPTTNTVVQMGPGPDSRITFADSPRLTQEELSKKAEAFLSAKAPNFAQVESTFSYREMSKPGAVSYAFRWEAKDKPAGEDMLPFVQVVLSPAGDVMSFTDTRSLYSQN